MFGKGKLEKKIKELELRISTIVTINNYLLNSRVEQIAFNDKLIDTTSKVSKVNDINFDTINSLAKIVETLSKRLDIFEDNIEKLISNKGEKRNGKRK